MVATRGLPSGHCDLFVGLILPNWADPINYAREKLKIYGEHLEYGIVMIYINFSLRVRVMFVINWVNPSSIPKNR